MIKKTCKIVLTLMLFNSLTSLNANTDENKVENDRALDGKDGENGYLYLDGQNGENGQPGENGLHGGHGGNGGNSEWGNGGNGGNGGDAY